MSNSVRLFPQRICCIRLVRQGILLIAIAMGHAEAETASENSIAQIDAAISRGDLETAARLADTALLTPNLSKRDESLLLSERAVARSLTGNPRHALEDYNAAIGTRALPTAALITALLERGILQEMRGHLKDALRDYTEVLRLEPNSAAAFNRRANVYRRMRDFTASRRDYLKAIEANSANPERSYYGLGQIAEALNDLAGARSYFDKALVANPNFAAPKEALSRLNTPFVRIAPPQAEIQNPNLPHSPQLSSEAAHVGSSTSSPAPRAERHNTSSETPRLRPTIAPPPPHAALRTAQIGSWRSEDEAAGGWVIAVKRASKLLEGVDPSIVPVDIPLRGLFYRLRIKIHQNPHSFCDTLKSKGVSCIPVTD